MANSREVPQALLLTPMAETIPSEVLDQYLSSRPWEQVQGAFNFRSVSCPMVVRSGLIYRSGMLSFLTEKGKDEIASALDIKAVFDVRFKEEREKKPDPEIKGVEIVTSNVDKAALASREQRWKNLVDMYFFNLEMYWEIYREIFAFVLNHPDQPFLIHCTAGKDRTGVAIALLLAVAGVPHENIAYDFALTRIGIEPAREMIQDKLMGGRKLDLNSEALKAIAGCEPDAIRQFLERLAEVYNDGAEGFVQTKLGFSLQEVIQIRQNLSRTVS